MLTLILYVLALVCWLIAIILRKDPVASTPVVFLGITYFLVGSLFWAVVAW